MLMTETFIEIEENRDYKKTVVGIYLSGVACVLFLAVGLLLGVAIYCLIAFVCLQISITFYNRYRETNVLKQVSWDSKKRCLRIHTSNCLPQEKRGTHVLVTDGLKSIKKHRLFGYYFFDYGKYKRQIDLGISKKDMQRVVEILSQCVQIKVFV